MNRFIKQLFIESNRVYKNRNFIQNLTVVGRDF